MAYCIQLRNTGMYGMGQRRRKSATPFRRVTRGASCFSPGVTLCSKRAVVQLLDTYMETALEVDEEMHLCVVFSSFAATSARGVFQSNFPSYSAHLTPIGSVCNAQTGTPDGQF